MIEIMNAHIVKPSKMFDFWVDRSTALGNPFVIDGLLSRDDVCDAYDVTFWPRLEKDVAMRDAFNFLCGAYSATMHIRLFCWCRPKRCHAETIKREVEAVVLKALLRLRSFK